MLKTIEDYVAALGLDAYLVGGAVRDELLGLESKDADFLVPRVDAAGLRAALAPHGRVDELTVAGNSVGQRLYPRDREIRALVPAGIEFAPPRREVSTGPGRHDFEIVVDPEAPVEDDLARRDFTVNAMARRVDGDVVIDPFGGRRDLNERVLRTVSPNSFAEDPLRLLRGLRFISQLDLEPSPDTLQQMRDEASAIALISGERVGGGVVADGLGELSKLLLGAHPRKALRIARDTGVLAALLPEFEPAIALDQANENHDFTLDEHLFAVVQSTADAGTPLRVRLAALLHDLGKPGTPGESHEEAGAEMADGVLQRLRYPNDLRERVVAIIRYHGFEVGEGDARRARAFLALHGEGLALDLLDLKAADLAGKAHGPLDPDVADAIERFRAMVIAERASPHRLSDLAIDGGDLIELGFEPGPELGRTLDLLLAEVVERPELNERDTLLRHAATLLPQ